jgi:hypothetical protein
VSYLSHKFRLWQLKHQWHKSQKAFAKRFEALKRDKGTNPYAGAELQADEHDADEMFDEAIEMVRSRYLLDQAIELDVEVEYPKQNKELWKWNENAEHHILNQKGRNLVQDLINKQKDKNSEDWARFSKIFVPIISAIAGLIGTIIGLVAVMQHKK